MLDIDTIFSSRAKIKALRTLYYQKAPLPLRNIAYVSEIPPFSVQRALEQMAQEKLVLSKRKKQYRLFSLNRNHKHYPFLSGVFELEANQWPLPNLYHSKAKRLLDFICSAQALFKKAKTGS